MSKVDDLQPSDLDLDWRAKMRLEAEAASETDFVRRPIRRAQVIHGPGRPLMVVLLLALFVTAFSIGWASARSVELERVQRASARAAAAESAAAIATDAAEHWRTQADELAETAAAARVEAEEASETIAVLQESASLDATALIEGGAR